MKKYRFILLLFPSLVFFFGCSSIKNELIPTYNKGGYKVNVIKSKINSDEVTIKGKVFDVKTGIPIERASLTLGCYKIQTSPQGEYSFKTKNYKYDYDFIEVIAFGYKTVLTNYLDLTAKNEVKIDFYLIEDDRPFIDCPMGIQLKN